MVWWWNFKNIIFLHMYFLVCVSKSHTLFSFIFIFHTFHSHDNILPISQSCLQALSPPHIYCYCLTTNFYLLTHLKKIKKGVQTVFKCKKIWWNSFSIHQLATLDKQRRKCTLHTIIKENCMQYKKMKNARKAELLDDTLVSTKHWTLLGLNFMCGNVLYQSLTSRPRGKKNQTAGA